MARKKDQRVLLLLVCLFLIITLVDVCREKIAKTPTVATQSSTAAGESGPSPSDNGNLLLGNPSHASHNVTSTANYLIDHHYYTESYNSIKGIPNWVSWHIDSSDLGSAGRTDSFRPDNNLPGGWYVVTSDDYTNSGFNRGHNCPSGDRTSSSEANAATFFMDNIIPQAPNNNKFLWEHFETYCRNAVKKGFEVYVVMGNYGAGGTGEKGYSTKIANGHVAVPAHIWKVAVFIPEKDNDLARIDGDTRVIAIDTPNRNDVSNDWMKYITTVDFIEKESGLDLLSALPDDIENALESKLFTGGN